MLLEVSYFYVNLLSMLRLCTHWFMRLLLQCFITPSKCIIVMIACHYHLPRISGSGGVFFSKVVAIFNHLGGSYTIFKNDHRGCLNNPIFSNLGLYACCLLTVEHFSCAITNCGRDKWVIPSPLSIVLRPKNYYLVHQQIFLPDCFHYIFSIAIFSSTCLLVGLLM